MEELNDKYRSKSPQNRNLKGMLLVRDATLADANRILEIYNYYVKNTAITFEYESPSLDEFIMKPDIRFR